MRPIEIETLRTEIAQREKELEELRQRLHQAQQSQEATTSSWPWPLEADDYKRYGRQMILSNISLKGQIFLRDASVLIVGLGGLGCPAAAYLVAAGVGTIGLVDGDLVEVSNLHRQILHRSTRVGALKVESARESLVQLNPHINVVTHPEHLSPTTALPLFKQYDLILDCTDHPSSRYLISDAAVLTGKPLISGAALRTDGQLLCLNYPKSTLQGHTGRGICYRCVFPKPPPPETVIPCGEGGILGPVVGVIGVLMALEAVKLIASGGHLPDIARYSPSNPPDMAERQSRETMLLFSALSDPQFRTIRIPGKRQTCPSCSDSPSITTNDLESGSYDYVQFCGRAVEERLPDEDRISARKLAEMQKARFDSRHALHNRANEEERGTIKSVLLLDVRPRPQFQICSLGSSINIPLSDLLAARDAREVADLVRASEPTNLRTVKEIVTICRLGNDSQVATKWLQKMDWSKAFRVNEGDSSKNSVSIRDVRGGFEAWRRDVESDWPDY